VKDILGGANNTASVAEIPVANSSTSQKKPKKEFVFGKKTIVSWNRPYWSTRLRKLQG
jgi:hypothetical protein